MRAYERLLRYVRINTESADGTGTSPSTACQLDLARLLEDEMKELGLQEVKISQFGVVTGILPATPPLPAMVWSPSSTRTTTAATSPCPRRGG